MAQGLLPDTPLIDKITDKLLPGLSPLGGSSKAAEAEPAAGSVAPEPGAAAREDVQAAEGEAPATQAAVAQPAGNVGGAPNPVPVGAAGSAPAHEGIAPGAHLPHAGTPPPPVGGPRRLARLASADLMAEESGVPLGLNAGPPAAAAAARVVHEAEQQISAAEAQVPLLFYRINASVRHYLEAWT